MTCKYYKTRMKNNKKEKKIYHYCSKQRKEINYTNCKCCPYREEKEKKPIKSRTYKVAKKEKDRFSIIYHDLTKCCVCGSKQSVEINEVFSGAYRGLSINYGMITPFCRTHHNAFHNNRLMNLYYKALFQKEFEKAHSREEFLKIFKQNYMHLYEKYKLNIKNV